METSADICAGDELYFNQLLRALHAFNHGGDL